MDAWRLVVRLVLPLLCLTGCHDGANPYLVELSAECEGCVQGDAGCGSYERDCTADEECEAAMLCALRFECFRKAPKSGCLTTFGCEASGHAEVLFLQVEQCLRAQCQNECGYVE